MANTQKRARKPVCGVVLVGSWWQQWRLQQEEVAANKMRVLLKHNYVNWLSIKLPTGYRHSTWPNTMECEAEGWYTRLCWLFLFLFPYQLILCAFSGGILSSFASASEVLPDSFQLRIAVLQRSSTFTRSDAVHPNRKSPAWLNLWRIWYFKGSKTLSSFAHSESYMVGGVFHDACYLIRKA